MDGFVVLVRVDDKPGGAVFDAIDAPWVVDGDSQTIGFVEQGVEDGVGVVGGREHLAGGFLLEGDAEPGEEIHAVLGAESFEDRADDRGFGGGILVFVDLVVGDIAASPACDEDFDAYFFGPVDEEDAFGAGIDAP